jgi:hypothetical protein
VHPGPADSFGEELHLVVPPYSAYLRAVRLLAADAAVRSGLDCEETEDFRLAVDELCQAVMKATDHAVLLSFECGPTGVVARGSARARDGCNAELSELSATIVDALADQYEFTRAGTDLGFVVLRKCAVVHR